MTRSGRPVHPDRIRTSPAPPVDAVRRGFAIAASAGGRGRPASSGRSGRPEAAGVRWRRYRFPDRGSARAIRRSWRWESTADADSDARWRGPAYPCADPPEGNRTLEPGHSRHSHARIPPRRRACNLARGPVGLTLRQGASEVPCNRARGPEPSSGRPPRSRHATSRARACTHSAAGARRSGPCNLRRTRIEARRPSPPGSRPSASNSRRVHSCSATYTMALRTDRLLSETLPRCCGKT